MKHLGIYKDAMELMMLISKRTRQAARDVKFTHIQDLGRQIRHFIVVFGRSQRRRGQERLDTIDELIELLDDIDTIIHVVSALQGFTLPVFSEALDLVVSLKDQTGRWRTTTLATVTA